ncbi:MAG: PIN domain-containing protein [Chloroflexi bacterium]|nr:PIN domain-containing protein [Chloroflexota bacterium]
MNPAYVDANVILRFLCGDPPDMAAQARELFEAVERGEIVLWIDEIVLAEVVWVLHSFYHYAPERISRVMQELLSHEGLQAEDKPGLLVALTLFADRNIDFADVLVAVHMGRRGVREIFSFDRHFDHLPGMIRRCPGKQEQTPA